MTLTKAEIAQLEALTEKFEEAVHVAIGRHNAHVRENGYPSLSLKPGEVQIDCGKIRVYWEEYYSHGGYDTGEYTLPFEIIMPGHEGLAVELAQKEIDAKETAKKKQAEKDRDIKLAELERLKKELGIE